jgi:uncharacterized UBP type Zn finger protein
LAGEQVEADIVSPNQRQLMAMGFTRAQVSSALRQTVGNADTDAALELLLSGMV